MRKSHEVVKRVAVVCIGMGFAVLASAASAALLVDLDFQEGASGSAVTSAANQGTLGGTATGTDFNESEDGVSYGAGSLSEQGGSASARANDLAAVFRDENTGDGTNPEGGRVLYSIGAGEIAADSDWSLTFAVRFDGEQYIFDRIVEPIASSAGDDGTNNHGYRVDFGDIDYTPDAGDNIFADDQWHHVALTSDYDGSSNTGRSFERLYIDGELIDWAAFAIRDDYSGGFDLSLGSQSNGYRPFNGALDDVQFYNEWLDDDAVYQNYYDAILIPEPASFVLLGLGALALMWRRRRGA